MLLLTSRLQAFTMKDRILSLLGSGLQPALVASAVGCNPSYISQLLEDQQFAFDVATRRCKDIENLTERDAKWNNLEDILLTRLNDLVPYMLRPREVLHALQVVNNAKRRSQEFINPTQQHVTNNVVVLNLPPKTINKFELSPLGEVISIEGKQLIPLPTDILLREVSSLPAKNDEQLEQLDTKRYEERERRSLSVDSI
jgi:hypothetical protein